MTKYFYCLLPIACCLLLVGCNGKPSVVTKVSAIKKINFYVRYLEETRNLYAEAIFEGDTTSMEMKGGVQFQEKNMRGVKLPTVGWRYQVDVPRQASAPDSAFFQYINPEGDSVKYAVVLPKLTNLRVLSGGGFTKKTGGLIGWEGPACTEDDALVIRLTDTTGTSYNFNHIGGTHGAKVDLLPPQFKDVAVGNATIAVTRRNIKTEKNNAGTKILTTTEYYMRELPTVVGEGK